MCVFKRAFTPSSGEVQHRGIKNCYKNLRLLKFMLFKFDFWDRIYVLWVWIFSQFAIMCFCRNTKKKVPSLSRTKSKQGIS